MKNYLPLLLLLGACASPPSGVTPVAAPTRAQLEAGGIAVAGVSGTAATLAQPRAHGYGEVLRQRLQEGLTPLGVGSENALIFAIGQDDYTDLLDTLALERRLDGDTLALIRRGVTQRYLVFVRVVENRVESHRSHLATTGAPSHTLAVTQRGMRIAVSIYDLESGERVWGEALALERQNTKTYYHDQGVLATAPAQLSAAQLDTLFPLPSPPAERNLLSSLFTTLGRRLAEP